MVEGANCWNRSAVRAKDEEGSQRSAKDFKKNGQSNLLHLLEMRFKTYLGANLFGSLVVHSIQSLLSSLDCLLLKDDLIRSSLCLWLSLRILIGPLGCLWWHDRRIQKTLRTGVVEDHRVWDLKASSKDLSSELLENCVEKVWNLSRLTCSSITDY